MNAKASGMPAKLAATPENVVSAVRTTRGVPVADRRVGDQEAEQRRRATAVTRLTSMLFL